jgi:hypothetical protein
MTDWIEEMLEEQRALPNIGTEAGRIAHREFYVLHNVGPVRIIKGETWAPYHRTREEAEAAFDRWYDFAQREQRQRIAAHDAKTRERIAARDAKGSVLPSRERTT